MVGQGAGGANHNIKHFTSMEKIDTGIHIGRAGSEQGANSTQEATEESDDEAATNDYKQVKTWLAGHPDAGVRDADCRSSVADVSVVSIVSVVAVVAVLQIHHLPTVAGVVARYKLLHCRRMVVILAISCSRQYLIFERSCVESLHMPLRLDILEKIVLHQIITFS